MALFDALATRRAGLADPVAAWHGLSLPTPHMRPSIADVLRG